MGKILDTGGSVLLRPWRRADAPVVLAAAREPLMARQFDKPVDTVAAAEGWIADGDLARSAGTAFAFAVLDAQGSPVGNVAVSNVDRRHLTGWMSYWVRERAQGQGLASRACRVAARWAFAELTLFRLELGHRVDNPASCKVALAAGFTPEGVERAKLLYNGTRFDVERHARLATDPGPA
ncbi:GNAT family N-acetyltransferase [Amycolatopsis sp. cmx-11-51]|uniref:GNAT family N-acetyltransferase n=1 Tax=unclassified Amycolatopsis TaxID=2618356 RepID=UPI0039E3F226